MSDWKIEVVKADPENIGTHDLLVSFLTCSNAWKRLSKPARAAVEAAYDPDHQGVVDAHVNTLASLERHGFIHPDCRLTDAAREVVRWVVRP